MQTRRRISIAAAVLLVVVIPLAGASDTVETGVDVEDRVAPKQGRADGIDAWSVDSGGGESSGGGFSLTATIGQPDSGVLTEGGTVLEGGLWSGVGDPGSIFDDGFESGGTDLWSAAVGGNP